MDQPKKHQDCTTQQDLDAQYLAWAFQTRLAQYKTSQPVKSLKARLNASFFDGVSSAFSFWPFKEIKQKQK